MKKRGRPKTDTEGVLVRLPRVMIDQLDAMRSASSDKPTRPEMIRRVLAEKFEAEENLGERGLPPE